MVTALSLVLMMCSQAFAVGTSLLDTTTTTTVQGFADNLLPTVLAIVAIIIPAGLSIWALGLGINKGISYLQKRANHAIK